MVSCVIHSGGLVEFPDAMEIDPNALNAWMELRRECEPEDYTLNEEGNYVNRGGYTFTPDQYSGSPTRFLNLTPDGEDTTFHDQIRAVMYDCLVKYVQEYPSVARSIWWRTDGQIAAYKDGQSMGSHQDREIEYTPGEIPISEAPVFNEITGSMILQGCGEGGYLKFALDGAAIAPTPGTVVFYPSNYIGAHAVTSVREGERIAYIEFYGQGTPGGGQGTGQVWLSELINPHTGNQDFDAPPLGTSDPEASPEVVV
jgi:hypothetical protein